MYVSIEPICFEPTKYDQPTIFEQHKPLTQPNISTNILIINHFFFLSLSLSPF